MLPPVSRLCFYEAEHQHSPETSTTYSTTGTTCYPFHFYRSPPPPLTMAPGFRGISAISRISILMSPPPSLSSAPPPPSSSSISLSVCVCLWLWAVGLASVATATVYSATVTRVSIGTGSGRDDTYRYTDRQNRQLATATATDGPLAKPHTCNRHHALPFLVKMAGPCCTGRAIKRQLNARHDDK